MTTYPKMLMGSKVDLQRVFTCAENVRYELYATTKRTTLDRGYGQPAAIIRAVDLDTGNLFTMRGFNDYAKANDDFNETMAILSNPDARHDTDD